ncbi:MAG: hypothetical protein J0M15_09540 [Deltaproteobacteria bacterium]|nr:hypothetical protein [Deltaproteobacteria bacterium]
MKLIFFFFILLRFVDSFALPIDRCLFFYRHSISYALSPDEQLVSDFLNQLPLLRLFMTNSPGTGHQAMTLDMIHRVLHLGYKGRMQVVYDDHILYGFGDNRIKLATLFEEFNPEGSGLQRLSETLELISLSEFQKRHQQQVDMAIAPAHDGGGYLFGQQTGALPAVLKASLVLTINPSNWIYPAMVTVQRGFKVYEKPLPQLDSFQILQEVPSESAALNSAKARDRQNRQILGGSSEEFLRNILKVTGGTHASWDLAPIYGLGFMKTPTKLSGESVLVNYVRALARAMKVSPKNFKKSGVILPIFNDLSPSQLASIKSGLNDPSVNLQLLTGIDQVPLQQVLLDETLESSILLLNVGPVPRPIFSYLMTKATLPILAEGKGTLSLLQAEGKVYIDTRRELETTEKADVPNRLDSILEEQSRLLWANLPWTEEREHKIAEFILLVSQANSWINKSVNSRKKEFGDPKKDKIFQALKIIEKEFAGGDPLVYFP